MSKAFKATDNSPRKVEVGVEDESTFFLSVVDNLGRYHSLVMDNTAAPALALAILEAAGYTEEMNLHASPVDHVGLAMFHLHKGINAQAKAAAEAKEREELEAEALALWNAHQRASYTFSDWVPYERFGTDDCKRTWLAVAKKARELAGK